MPRHLQAPIGNVQTARAITTARILRVQQFFQHIHVRHFYARTKSVAHRAWKLSNLGNNPAQQIAGQHHGGGLAGSPAGSDWVRDFGFLRHWNVQFFGGQICWRRFGRVFVLALWLHGRVYFTLQFCPVKER